MSPIKRIHYLDLAKGILILLVVLHHFGSAFSRIGITSPFSYAIFSWQGIYTAFFMQCFFLVSGYCSTFETEWKLFFKKIIRQIIIPWMVFELLQATFDAVYFSDFTWAKYKTFFFTEPCTTLWFLNALAFSKAVVYLLRRATHNDIAILVITLVMLVLAIILNQLNIGHNPLAIRQSTGSCFFVALGYWLKKNPRLYDQLMKYSPYIYIPVFGLLLLLGLNIPVYTAMMNVSLRQLPLFIILSVSGSFTLLRLCQVWNSNAVLEYFGKNSLIIYGLHFCPLYAFIVYYHALILPDRLRQFLFFVLVVYVSELITCVLLVKIFQSKYLRWITGRI